MTILKIRYTRVSEFILNKNGETLTDWSNVESIYVNGELEDYLHDENEAYTEFEIEYTGCKEDGLIVNVEKQLIYDPWNPDISMSLSDFFSLKYYSHAFK